MATTIIKSGDSNYQAKVNSDGALLVDIGGTEIIVEVSGTVSVDNFPAVQPVSQSGLFDVSVNNFPATFAVTQSTSPWVVSGTVAVSNFPATQPVSGTVAVTQSTSPWVVSNGGTFAVQAAQSGAWTQDLTKVGGTSVALGQTTMSASFPVTIANNQSALAVSQSGTWTVGITVGAAASLSNVNDTAGNTTLLSSNSSRRGVLVFNDSTSDLYLKYGATASLTSFSVKIAAGGYWEMPQPVYTGQIDGIWSSDASGAARITEQT